MELAVVLYNVTPSIEGGNEISEFSNAALFYGREVIRRAQVSWNTNPKDGEGVVVVQMLQIVNHNAILDKTSFGINNVHFSKLL